MSTYTDTRIVCLTSQSATTKRNSTYLSDLFFGFGYIYKNDPDIIHRQVQLLSAQIPYSFYVINYTNNLFRYKLGTGAVQNDTVPVGNYTATSLLSTLKALVLAKTGTTVVFSISSINGCITITNSSSAFTVYNNFQYSIGSVLGCDSNTTVVGTPCILPRPLNLLGIKTLQIRSSNLVMKNVSSIEGGQTILLASIPVSAVPFGMIEYTDKGNLISIDNQDVDDILIELIDGETGQYINMNGQDWCITLAFHLTKVVSKDVGPTIPPRPIPIIKSPPDLSKNMEDISTQKQSIETPPLTKDEQTLQFLQT